MANIYKNAQFNLTTTAKTDIYTCPTGRTALVKNVHAVNYGGSTSSISAYLYDSSASTEYQIDEHSLSSKAAQDISEGLFVLESGDVYRLKGANANAFSGTMSILEIFDEKSA